MELIYNRFNCFVGGNLFTISFIPVESILHTVILGFIGGIIGMLSKDVYNIIKKYFEKGK